MPSIPDDFRYPTLPHDDSRKLLAQAGSFWANVYDGRAFVETLLYARGQAEKQSIQDLTELQQAFSRFTVPIWHRQHLTPLRLLESSVTRRPLRLGDGHVLGEPGIVLGGEDGRHPYGVDVPAALKYVPLITNRITDPSWVLLPGVDFQLVAEEIQFRENPFENPFAAIEPVYEGSEVVDRAMLLWLWEAQSDTRLIEQFYGYTTGVSQASSPSYRDLVNSVWDAWVEGCSSRSLIEFFAGVTANPVAQAEETVQYAGQDAAGWYVITEQNVYRFPAAANVIVTAGQELRPQDPLTDTVLFYDLTTGELDAAVESLQITKEMLDDGYLGGLVFRNKEVPLVVETVDGKTKVSFEIEGFPGDVSKFWADVHVRGTAEGSTTLARLLDKRGPLRPDEPVAAVLPATVNPARFLVENVLRFHAAVVQIKTAGIPAGAEALGILRLLRKVIPPWHLLLVLVELTVDPDLLDVPEIGEEELEGIQTGSLDETLDITTIGQESLVAYYVHCSCE